MRRAEPRGGTPRWRRAAPLLLAASALAVLATPPVAAQSNALDLSRATIRQLVNLQEDWLQWMSAFYQDREEEAAQQISDLKATLEVLGFGRVPELSIGASVRAVESARQGNTQRAGWALDAAEALDPGRPETAFASAMVAAADGSFVSALRHELSGYARLFSLNVNRFLWWRNLELLAIAALLLAGGAFVVLQMLTNGVGLFRALAAALSRTLPGPLAQLLGLVALLWPLALPAGLVWLLLYWSVLLWGFGTISERVVVTTLWVVVGAVPLVLTAQQRDVAIELSPPSHAMHAIEEGRLYGALFTDLGLLMQVLPDDPAVWELVADVDRILGQWERARTRYVQVIDVEPENPEALINIGAYYFRKADYGTAVQYFQRASTSDGRAAAAFYNMSQAYSEALLFEDQKGALAQATAVDKELVTAWLQEEQKDRVVTLDGGVDRQGDIRAKLGEIWGAPASGPSGSTFASLALPLLALGLAWAVLRLQLVRGGGGSSIVDGTLGDGVAVAVPGLASIEEGHGGRAYFGLLTLVVLLLLVFGLDIGYEPPWGLEPPGLVPVVAGILGLVVFYGLRVVAHLRGGG